MTDDVAVLKVKMKIAYLRALRWRRVANQLEERYKAAVREKHRVPQIPVSS